MSTLMTGLLILIGLSLFAKILCNAFVRSTRSCSDGTIPLAHFTFQLKRQDDARAQASKLRNRLLKRGVLSVMKETQDAYGGGTVYVSVDEKDYLKAQKLI